MKNPVPLHLLPFILFSSFLLSIFFLGTPVTLAETITLTTYYPSPFGAYDRMILVPRAALVGACTQGTLYYNTTIDAMEYCNSSLVWSGVPIGNWRVSGTDLYPSSSSWNVAIGTTTAGTTPLTVLKSQNNTTDILVNNPTAGAAASAGIYLQSDSGHGVVRAYSSAHGVGAVRDAFGLTAQSDAAGGVFVGAEAASAPINFYTGGPVGSTAARMAIDSNGQVGIGVTPGNYPLEVGKASSAGRHTAIFYNPGGAGIAVGELGGAGYASIQSLNGGVAGGDLAINASNAGNVGIMVTPPTQALDVNGSIRMRGGTPGAGRVLTDIDGAGTGGWRDVVYSP